MQQLNILNIGQVLNKDVSLLTHCFKVDENNVFFGIFSNNIFKYEE